MVGVPVVPVTRKSLQADLPEPCSCLIYLAGISSVLFSARFHDLRSPGVGNSVLSGHSSVQPIEPVRLGSERLFWDGPPHHGNSSSLLWPWPRSKNSALHYPHGSSLRALNDQDYGEKTVTRSRKNCMAPIKYKAPPIPTPIPNIANKFNVSPMRCAFNRPTRRIAAPTQRMEGPQRIKSGL